VAAHVGHLDVFGGFEDAGLLLQTGALLDVFVEFVVVEAFGVEHAVVVDAEVLGSLFLEAHRADQVFAGDGDGGNLNDHVPVLVLDPGFHELAHLDFARVEVV